MFRKHTLAQGSVDPFPGTVKAPSAEVNGGRSSCCRKVVRQYAPSASARHDYLEDGLEDLAQGVDPGASLGFGGRQMRLYVGQLGIG